MSTIIEKLKARSADLFAGKGATPSQIAEAEQALGVKFAEDYRKCLLEFGIFAFNGHELTGISTAPRINVVDTTRRQREYNAEIASDWYTIEEANIDGITIWQEGSGTVYEVVTGNKPVKLANSLSEYLGI